MIFLLYFTLLTQAAATYRHHDQALLPDPVQTPGQVRTTDRASVCSGGSTKQYRHTTEQMKRDVCLAYGLEPHCEGREKNEIDHLISLELGGADTEANLWPQPYFQHPGAHEKDEVENWLHKQVCQGRMTLTDAQQQIATDWYAVYLKIHEQPTGVSWARSHR